MNDNSAQHKTTSRDTLLVGKRSIMLHWIWRKQSGISLSPLVTWTTNIGGGGWRYTSDGSGVYGTVLSAARFVERYTMWSHSSCAHTTTTVRRFLLHVFNNFNNIFLLFDISYVVLLSPVPVGVRTVVLCCVIMSYW